MDRNIESDTFSHKSLLVLLKQTFNQFLFRLTVDKNKTKLGTIGLMANNEEPELEPLKCAVLESLEKKGLLNEIRAHLRSQVFNVLNEEFSEDKHNTHSKATISDQNRLINQLICQYLKFNSYNYSLNIFQCETGEQNHSNIDKELVRNKLGVQQKEDNSQLPLLNTIIQHFLDRKTSL